MADIETKRLYLAWTDWCTEQGRDYPGTIQSFGRDLRAAISTLSTAQHRRYGELVRVYKGLTLKSMWNIREGV
jgi:putative DNA primase/helicase